MKSAPMALLGLSALLLAGCHVPADGPVASSKQPAPSDLKGGDATIESNIVKVNKFFSSEPWLSFSGDGTRRIDGIKFSVYLEGPRRAKGVFGTGTLVVTLYRLDREPTGRERATQVWEWDLPPDKAYVWRGKQETALGWGYGLRLQWGPNLKLDGRQVAVVVKYIREDGKTIYSSRKVLKVPAPEGTIMVAPEVQPARPATAARKPRPS